MDIRRSPVVNGAAYLLLAAGTTVAQMKGMHALEYVCRPLMLIVLSLWFYFNSRRFGDRFTLLVQGGLFFSLLGDSVMMFKHLDEFNFVIGLAAFFIAHVCYTLAFSFNVIEVGAEGGVFISAGLAAGLLVFGVFVILDLLGNQLIDDFLIIPVTAHAAMFTLMGIAAAFRFRRTFPRSFWLVLTGTLALIASDSLLLQHEFSLRPDALPPVWISISYAAAQFLIAAGCLLHVLDPELIRRKRALET